MRIRIIILFLLIGSLAQAQSIKDTIDPENFSSTLFEKGLYDRVNEYRRSLFLNPLTFNKKVYGAAEDHVNYILKTGKLTHEQDVEGKRTVYDRVKKYTGVTRFTVAENIAKSIVLKPAMMYDDKGVAGMHTAYTYEQAVNYVFNAWKQSDFHRQNMSKDSYTVTAIAVRFDPKDYSITAVQVFARFGS